MTENALRFRSDEEDDLLARSNKKVKAVPVVNIEDASMEDKQLDENKSEETPPFKDKLLGQFAPKGFSEDGPGLISVTTNLTTSEKRVQEVEELSNSEIGLKTLTEKVKKMPRVI